MTGRGAGLLHANFLSHNTVNFSNEPLLNCRNYGLEMTRSLLKDHWEHFNNKSNDDPNGFIFLFALVFDQQKLVGQANFQHHCLAGVGSAIVDNFLYVVGGHSGSSYLNTVQRYDPISDSWLDSSGMMYCRCNFGLTAL